MRKITISKLNNPYINVFANREFRYVVSCPGVIDQHFSTLTDANFYRKCLRKANYDFILASRYFCKGTI